MRISANFNPVQPNFGAIRVTKAAERAVDICMQDDEFHDIFDKLTEISDKGEDDVLIQLAPSKRGINFQAVDPYNENVTCYLASDIDNDPLDAIKRALDSYIKHTEAPTPPKVSVTDRKEAEPAPAAEPKKSIFRKLFDLF